MPKSPPSGTAHWTAALTARCGRRATQKVREAGRVVNVSAVVATAVNHQGQREIVGFDIVTAEDTPSWTEFLRGLVARGLAGVELVISRSCQNAASQASIMLLAYLSGRTRRTIPGQGQPCLCAELEALTAAQRPFGDKSSSSNTPATDNASTNAASLHAPGSSATPSPEPAHAVRGRPRDGAWRDVDRGPVG